jgi:ribbon-helix-helix CopG family protein
MALESRSRMISFRLTDEEYDRFRRLCVSRGLRNVSELVRTAVNQLIDQTGVDLTPPAPEVVVRVATLESRLADLAVAVAQMESSILIAGTPRHENKSSVHPSQHSHP